MSFFALAAGLISKTTTSLAARLLADNLRDIKTKRRMARLVEDAVDRIVGQAEDYLISEKVSNRRKGILIREICAKLQPLADDPQQLFVGNLDGTLIFKKCHPDGELPELIRQEQLGQFYTVLFPQIAHFLSGSRIALAQWQAEGYREEFKRLSQLADEIQSVNSKVADLPVAVVSALMDQTSQEAETLLREFAQILLNNLLFRLDLSPLRAERVLYGSLTNHFVIPAFREQRESAETIEQESVMLNALATSAARRIVHGGAGVGKTTWSFWLQSRLLQTNPRRLAVVLRLRNFTDIENRSLLELLRECAGPHLREALTDKVLRKWHATGQLVVILDGFDEVPEERRDTVEKWIKDLAIHVQKTCLIVTSRPLQTGHLNELVKPWQQWDLLPFDSKRILEFIERWHRYLPECELSTSERKVDASALAHTFFNDPSLKPLADTPLMLATLLFVHHRDKKLPSGRVDLYERYITAMLGLRDCGLGIQARATKLSDKEKRRVLAQIALHFHLHGVNEINDDTMSKLVIQALTKFGFDENVERLLPALYERTGLLEGPGTWSFTHKTIGEFLVAELICEATTLLDDNRRLDNKELWSHRHEDAWTAVLFFWAGKTSPRELEEFISDLLGEGTSDATLLAMSLLDDQGERLDQDTQRRLALVLIGRFSASDYQSDTHVVCTTPSVPAFAFTELSDDRAIKLRGLSSALSINALRRFFVRGVLVSSDINVQNENCRGSLTVAAIWALMDPGSHVTLDLRHYVGHLPMRDLALYCFQYACNPVKREVDIGSFRAGIQEWLEAFPEGRGWVPLLLATCAIDIDTNKASGATQQIGTLLWEWRDKPVDEEWLRESDGFRGWGTNIEFDLMQAVQKLLVEHREDAWGVTVEQYADLVMWCDQILTRRAALKAAETKKLPHAPEEGSF